MKLGVVGAGSMGAEIALVTINRPDADSAANIS